MKSTDLLEAAAQEAKKLVVYVEAIRAELGEGYPSSEQLLMYGIADFLSCAKNTIRESADSTVHTVLTKAIPIMQSELDDLLGNLENLFDFEDEFQYGGEWLALQDAVEGLPPILTEESIKTFRGRFKALGWL